MSMKTCLHIGAVTAGTLLASGALAQGTQPPPERPDAGVYHVLLTPLNNAGVIGKAQVVHSGNRMTVMIQARGLAPGQPHWQLLHEPDEGSAACPTLDADADGDHLIGWQEGRSAYGPDVFSLRPYPTADDGRIALSRTYTVGEADTAALQRRALVLYGLATEGGYEQSIPVACGRLVSFDASEAPPAAEPPADTEQDEQADDARNGDDEQRDRGRRFGERDDAPAEDTAVDTEATEEAEPADASGTDTEAPVTMAPDTDDVVEDTDDAAGAEDNGMDTEPVMDADTDTGTDTTNGLNDDPPAMAPGTDVNNGQTVPEAEQGEVVPDANGTMDDADTNDGLTEEPGTDIEAATDGRLDTDTTQPSGLNGSRPAVNTGNFVDDGTSFGVGTTFGGSGNNAPQTTTGMPGRATTTPGLP